MPGAIGTADYRWRAADGSWHWLESSATNLANDPAVKGLIVSMRDTTEQRQAEAALRTSERHYTELFERAIEAIYTADLDGNFTSVNPAAERISGFSRDELLAMNFFDLIAPEERERARELLTAAFTGRPEMMAELELVAKNGGRVVVEVSGRVVTSDGYPSYLEGIVRDTSERHLLEEQRLEEALDPAASVNDGDSNPGFLGQLAV